MLLWLSSKDGEQFSGGQGYDFDKQDQQEYFAQGKYIMGSSLFPIHFSSLNSCCMCLLDRNFLGLNYCLVTYGLCIWVALLELNQTMIL